MVFCSGDVVQTGRTILVDGIDLEGPKQPKSPPKPRLILLMEISAAQLEK